MNTEPKPMYGEGTPETHPLTWRLSKQEHVRNADDDEAPLLVAKQYPQWKIQLFTAITAER